MKVYVVLQDFEYEGSSLRGVYSTPFKAQAWINTQPVEGGVDYSIHEVEIDEDWE